MLNLKFFSYIRFWLLLTIVCFVAVTLSPRYGYRLHNGLQESDVYRLTSTISDKSEVSQTTAFYTDAEGNQISLNYSSRFFGDLSVSYNGEPLEKVHIHFDGSHSPTEYLKTALLTEPLRDKNGLPVNFMWDVVSKDAGAFWFWCYIKPLLLLALGMTAAFYRKKTMFATDTAPMIFHIFTAAMLLLALLMSLRIL